MTKINRSIQEAVLKLKNILLKEAGEVTNPAYDTDAMNAKRSVGTMLDPAEMTMRYKSSANQYADRLDGTSRIKADAIVKNTILKGYGGAVDASFIDDLDTRWANKKRISLDSNKTNSFDYIIQSLAMVYHTPDGQNVEVGGQSFPVTSGMKKNAYEGLLRMFDLQDASGRWKWFTFGSNIPGISMVPTQYRPRISTKLDGTLDFDEVDQYMSYLNFWLKNGQLLNILNKGGFADKGMAYVLTVVRNKYIDLKRLEKSKKKEKLDYDAYSDPNYKVDMKDPRMHGMKKDLGGNIDASMDLRYAGKDDDTVTPNVKFINALKAGIDGADVDADQGDVVEMAKFIGAELLKFVTIKFENKPYIIDMYKAKLAGNPKSLNHITNPEYKDIYPFAFAQFSGKPPNYPQVYFRNAYKDFIQAQADVLKKQFIKDMELDMVATPAHDDWKEKGEKLDEPKPTYDDYADPTKMVKGMNKRTGKPITFQDDDEYYQSLEETEEMESTESRLDKALGMAIDNFFLTD